MAAVALIGPDGAGKTTIARRLVRSGTVPLRYLYMGINTESSNLALPTSRLIVWLKPWLRSRRSGAEIDRSSKNGQPVESRSPGPLWTAARLVNRVAEEWFRQFVSWCYQRCGYVVLYDRHFLFDFASEVVIQQPQSFDKRLHYYLLNHFYPRPDLVVYLDAPGQILFARKGESTVEELNRRREAMLRKGQTTVGFIRVDASQPLDAVCEEIAGYIARLHAGMPVIAMQTTDGFSVR